MQTRKDGALRRIVEDGRLPIKTRRAAFAEMDSPSRLFLTKLANDPAVPAKLRLDAARKLPDAERRLAGGRAARKPPEQQRLEIDEHLRQAAEELGMSLDDSGDPEPQPESGGTPIVEPLPATPSVPVSGPSKSTPKEELAPAVPTETIPTSGNRELRDALLVQGRRLARLILAQQERCGLCPFNKEESKRLDDLQKQFALWERQFRIQFPDFDTNKEFSDERLRPPKPRFDFAQQRRTALTVEQLVQGMLAETPRQSRREARDDGMWSGMPPGI